MKDLVNMINESSVVGYEIELVVKVSDKSEHTYNINGIKNAIRDAITYNSTIEFNVSHQGKTARSTNLHEAIVSVDK